MDILSILWVTELIINQVRIINWLCLIIANYIFIEVIFLT